MKTERINDRLASYTLTLAEQAQAMLEFIERKTGRDVRQVIVRDRYWAERVQVEVVLRVVHDDAA